MMKLRVLFYRNASGREPVLDWLRGLDHEAKKIIGDDIKTVQYGWPLGMPLVKNLGHGLWEVRCQLRNGTARIVFLVDKGMMVVVHGFMKKSRKTPRNELETARRRSLKLKGDKR